jgi:ATP-dependent exoDNAse (exonuclease V) beta subunit
VIDTLEAERLRLQAFDLALADFIGDGTDGERLDLAVRYRVEGLADMVRTTYAHLRSLGHEHPRLPDLAEPADGDEIDALRDAAAEALAELGSAAGKRVADARNAVESCRALLTSDRLPDLGELGAHRFSANAANALGGPACARYLEAHAALVAHCSAHAEYADHSRLRHLLEAYDVRYGELKRERSGVDFDDLELRVTRLFEEHPEICADYGDRFTQVMVDEFQDTNRLQNKLIGQLDRNNLFRVGDERQSIYRFRHADVAVFREHHDAARAEGRAERITVNFRSRGEVLEVIDTLFESIWGDAFEPLREGPDARDGEPRLDPSVELLLSDRNPNRWKDVAACEEDEDVAEKLFGPSMRGVAVWRAAEARLMARRIDQLIRGGTYEAREVVVLVRATTNLSVYERALEERGISTYVLGGRGYWSQQQVSDLRAYLSALANPRDELALLSLLGSPLAGVSLDALVLVTELGRRVHGAWDALERLVPAGGVKRDPEGAALAEVLPEADLRRLEAFVHRFRAERLDAPRMSLERLIDRAVTDSGYDRTVLALPAGDRRMANVRKLMRMAREFEGEEGRDLRAFIDFVAERDLVQEREGQAPLESEDVDAVRLMTVHRAKGLEFPVVCVADLGKKGRDDDSALRITEEGSVGIRLASIKGKRMDGAQLVQIKERQRREDEEEERRVFYVAATRAQEHLILSGATDLEKLPPAADMEEPMRWIHAALAERDGVRVEELRSTTLQAALPPADRMPAAPAAEPIGLDALQAPALAAVAVPAALPVSRLSYSGLESYKRCGYRFYLERALKLPRADDPRLEHDGASAAHALAAESDGDGAAEGLPALLRGSLVHLLLEELDFTAPVTPSSERVSELIASYGGTANHADAEDLRDMVTRFAASPLRERIGVAGRVRTELPFAFPLEPDGAGGRSLLINGIVDVHAAEADGLLIVDYKSDRLEGRDPAELTAEAYETQRIVYALAALQSGAARVEVVYCFLERPDQPVSAVFASTDAPELERRLLELAAGVVGGRFEPSDLPHRELCAGCPGKAALCTWGPERTEAPA